jgi:hypothetical protein
MGSIVGDNNPNDDVHRTFFQLIPTARTYARLPFFNLMNSSDVFFELLLRPHDRVLVRTDFHWLRVTDGRDLWYSGGGATSNTFFGYAGSPANGNRALATLADISVTVALIEHLTVEGYYGHAFGAAASSRRSRQGCRLRLHRADVQLLRADEDSDDSGGS